MQAQATSAGKGAAGGEETSNPLFTGHAEGPAHSCRVLGNQQGAEGGAADSAGAAGHSASQHAGAGHERRQRGSRRGGDKQPAIHWPCRR
ncbi:hypothetical protein HaLaN_04258 [Haematococcus lacustris]|uniref:Uncharacterized protein n=1 Tax=Haematococcus lacustris TaxID=44745 RepID=A0A699YI60_HAELA|nr:hypothetical protein HaLaN_04258 [Haematococcus lacustris]